MKTANSVLMKQARESLVGKWGLAIGVLVVYLFITVLFKSIPDKGHYPLLLIMDLCNLLVSGPLALGLAIFSLSLSRNQNPKFSQIFEGFKRFGTAMATYILMGLFVLLWALLLLVPGIIACLSYSMAFFILVDDPSITARGAISKSKKMMYGHKWKLFCLGLRFFGWAILSVLTAGIGFLWLVPYLNISTVKFYDDIKGSVPSVA